MTFQETVNQALARLASPSIEVEREQSQAVKDASILQWPELANMLPPNSNALTISNENAVNGLVGIPCKPNFATELRREITEWLEI